MNIKLNIDKRVFNDTYFPYLLDYKHRYEVYYGSAGSGKSQFVFQKMIIKAMRRVRRVLVVRKVAKSNLNSTFKMTLDILSQFQILTMCGINKTTLTITLPNGSEFLFYGCDDIEKLKSIAGITDIICEEATELTLDDYTQLDLRLRSNEKDLQMICMFNPVSKANWVYKMWFDESVEPQPHTFILKTTYKDNRFLPEDYIASLLDKARTNITYYKIYVLGEFCSLDRLVYNNWKVQEIDISKLTSLPLLVGMDYGFVNDKSTLVCSLLDEKNKTVYIFDEWGETGKTNQELAEIVKAKGYSKSLIIADSAEQKSIEEMRRLGIVRIRPSVKGPDSIIHGIQKIQQYTLIVDPKCQGIIEEFENYTWQKDKTTNEYINKPNDSYNHYLDALRYSFQCVGGGQLSTMNKNVLGL